MRLLLLMVLIFASNTAYCDIDTTIYLNKTPITGMKWGDSVDYIKANYSITNCHEISGNIKSCFVNTDKVRYTLVFDNNHLSSLSLSLTNDMYIDDMINFFNEIIGDKYASKYTDNKYSEYTWNVKYSSYALQCYKESNKCSLNIRPTSTIKYANLIKSDSRIKLHGLELGYSDINDLSSIAVINKWNIKNMSYQGDGEHYHIDNIGIDDVALTDMMFYDNKLSAVTYIISVNGFKKASLDFYKLLTDKYGKPYEDNGDYVVWKVNKDTYDEVNIVMEYNKSHDMISQITYVYEYLLHKQNDDELYDILRKKTNK